MKHNFKILSLRKLLVIAVLITLPAFVVAAPNTCDITDYGATPKNEFINTEAIQKAIDDCAENGGGKVLIPEGFFLSGSIILKSGVELHLHSNAALVGSTDPSHYHKLKGQLALILADGEENISITGKGTINGQGRKLALRIDSLYYAGKLDSVNYDHTNKRPRENVRPEIISFVNCSNAHVKGVTIKNSSGWVQTYKLCDNLVIDNIRVESTAFWNNDGIDVVDSKNVQITNSFVNAADDGICLKSEDRNAIVKEVYIANNIVRSSASAVKFGTASRGGFKNVKIENITAYDTYRSAIALESVDGGVLENIEVSNIRAINTGNAIFIRLGHRNKSGPISKLRNVSIKNIFVQVPFSRPDEEYDMRGPALPFFHNPIPTSITGIPAQKVENVTLENITISYPGRASKGMAYIPINQIKEVPEKIENYPEFSMFGELPAWGFYIRHVSDLSMKNIRLRVREKDFRPAVVLDDVANFKLINSKIYPTNFSSKQIVLDSVRQAVFQDNNIMGLQGDGIYQLKNNSEISEN